MIEYDEGFESHKYNGSFTDVLIVQQYLGKDRWIDLNPIYDDIQMGEAEEHMALAKEMNPSSHFRIVGRKTEEVAKDCGL